VCPVGALTAKDFRFARRVWELSATPSVCPGCATGCNIEIHAAQGKIWRLVPRENPAVNKFWMCDEGRFEYKAVHENRVLLPQLGGKRARFDAALAEAARMLRVAVAGEAGSVGVVFSYAATNEDTHALLRLAIDGLKLQRVYAGGRRPGWSDDILVSADKNPNTAGVERMVPLPLRTLKELTSDIATGALSTVLVLGNEALPVPAATPVELVVLASHKGPLVDAAQVTLPIATWAEVNGTFTNKNGRVQRIHAAIGAPGEAVPGWRAIELLAGKLGVNLAYASADEVFAEAAQRYPFLKDASWGPSSQPVQLRFGESRG
jgi:NADH-quinone oxidoreductase subunit G